MKVKKELLGVGLLIIVLLFFVVKYSSIIGISSDNLEKDARISHKINSLWKVSKSVNKRIGAMLFYNDEREKFIFSIYLNHPGISFGYFFASGGATSGIDDNIKKFSFKSYGSVLISMNVIEIAKIQLDNGIEVSTINIDSTKPFAEVIPINSGKITLFDVYGNEVLFYDE